MRPGSLPGVQEGWPGLTSRAIPHTGLAGGYDIKWLQIEQPGASLENLWRNLALMR
jgi:hypothetical protein